MRNDQALHVEAERMLAQEIEVFKQVDRITTPSKVECEIVQRLAPDKPVTVLPPYFYEAEEICPRDASHFASCSDVVFVGGFPHVPNVDAALFIAQEVMPLVWREQPDARLVLVGYAPPEEVRALAGPRVLVTGQVAAVEPYMEIARVNLAALRFGAGVKGKVVQALQLGVPVVTTPVGAEGIDIEPGHHAIVAEGASALADGVLSLFRDPARCAALSVAGTELVRRSFTRAAASEAIAKAFDMAR
jgi:glycosyltransferase involved in cell wall biosynthesis